MKLSINRVMILALGSMAVAVAQSGPTGQIKVDGKAVKLTNVYAYATEGFFDKKKDDTVVLLTDRPLVASQIRDSFQLQKLVDGGKLVFVRETINAGGQIVNFTLGHPGFKAPPSGGSTEHVFEGKLESKSVAGKVQTKGEQSFFGTKYEYEVTFQAAVEPKK